MTKRKAKPVNDMKQYMVTLKDGEKVKFSADWMFNNRGNLVFRVGRQIGSTTVVAEFAPETWSYVRRLDKIREVSKKGKR